MKDEMKKAEIKRLRDEIDDLMSPPTVQEIIHAASLLSDPLLQKEANVILRAQLFTEHKLTAANKRVEELEKELAEAKEAVLDALKTNQYRIGFEILSDRLRQEEEENRDRTNYYESKIEMMVRTQQSNAESIRERAAEIVDVKYKEYGSSLLKELATAIRKMETTV